MSRTYFKNQLYYFAFQKEKQAKKQEDIKKENQMKQKFAKSKRGQAVQKQKQMKKEYKQKKILQMHKNIHVDDSFTLKKSTSDKNKEQEDSNEKQFLKNLKKNNTDKKSNIFSTNYKPLTKLVVKEEVAAEKTQKQQKQEKIKNHMSFKKMQNNLKRILSLDNNNNNKDENNTQEKQKQQKQKNLQKTGVKQDRDEQENDKKSDNKQAKSQGEQKDEKKKTKKIKKQSNYVRLDLKRKYTERYTGKINQYKRKFTKNGRLKQKYRIQSQISLQDGQFYNNYISSLSSALCLTINLDDDDSNNSIQQFQAYYNTNSIEWDQQSLTQYMNKFFGFNTFRQGQYQTILNILNKKSTIFISETASGKSLTYILSSMILGGLSIVISPLVSLMLDQLNHLPKGFPAACISSLINREQRGRIIKMVHEGKVNLLFITPQSLQTDFIYHLQDFPPVNFVCIDEAHSLSELSHNFRTSFLALGDIVQNMIKYKSQRPTILGLTATANIETVISIKQKLNIQEQIRSNKTMNKNIYITISKEKGVNKYQSLIKYLHIPIIYKCKGILIYARTRKIMDQVFNYINNSSSFSVAIYHSALSNKQKTQTLKQFRQGTKKIVVATIALGMGLDFQNLQCVIHINMPKSIENYVQEVGRAGRRQRRAYCHLFLDQTDYITERNYIIADLLEKPLLKLLYSCLKTYSRQNLQKITKNTKNTKAKQITNQQPKAIKRAKLDKQKFIDENDENYLKNIYEESEQQIEKITIKNLQNINSIEEIKILEQQEQERQRVIKVATLMLELTKKEDNRNIIINEQNEEDQDDNEENMIKQYRNQGQAEDQEQHYYETANINTKLFYARSEKLKQLTQLRQEVILTLLIKIQSLLKDEKDIKFKVLPLSFEQIKIGFFKNNQEEVKKQSEFFRNLIHGCKTVRGTTYINLVRKCNLLGMKPIQLLANLYRLSNLYTIKIQLETPIFLWQFEGKKDNDQYQQEQQLSQLVQRGFDKLLCDQYIDKVVNEVNSVQKTSITKLNIFYSLAFNYSRLHMSNIIQKNLIIPHEQQIGQDCITKQFDNYFKSNLQQFYQKITDNENEIVIPTQMISKQDQKQIFSCISLFFKQEIANIIQPRTKQEYASTIRQLIGKYQNGKVITKIMMGVNSGQVSWKIYGTRSYWMLFKLKNYDELLQAVRKQIKEYKLEFQIEYS